MNIEIEIKNTGIFVLATVSIDGAKMLTLPFTSIEDAEKWAESCKPDIERLAKDCDCPKCREAETAKYEPEIKPEEPSPTWTPEVGMLVEWFGSPVVCEITYICDDGRIEINGLRNGTISAQFWEFRPIAELEGLEVGDEVYSITEDGIVQEFEIDEQYDGNLWVKACSVSIHSNNKGIPSHFGNGKQMFWRTRDRAERFGK